MRTANINDRLVLVYDDGVVDVETLRVYLAEEHGLRMAADRLHVARNTVTYRVKRAEELLPATTITGSSLELRLALEIAQTLYD
ncbi:helix-turn-helix domain-containing protein [Streptomyces sp. TP-A0356]|uniref:helix-turn-helix domain-containing protein n=1 Tax=Streptomyces sp. TP-A0356 TaxID=1359208 RepID=UPI0006E3A88E|nr:helix-turn-helix domain-containing protein [Streptomyces sp. TP-A0356]